MLLLLLTYGGDASPVAEGGEAQADSGRDRRGGEQRGRPLGPSPLPTAG